ncbi:MAG: hypothetical protein ACKO6N_02880 [Myxococcota bacterium]
MSREKSNNPTIPEEMEPPPPAPRYLRAAVHNVYHYTVLAGGLAASALTLNPAPALLSLGLSGLWLSVGTSLPPFRKAVERQHAEAVAAYHRAILEHKLSLLPPEIREEFRQLEKLQMEIPTLLSRRPPDEQALLQEEFARLPSLLDDYLSLAQLWKEVRQYVDKADIDKLRVQLGAKRGGARNMKEGPAQAVALKNVEVLQARLERLQGLHEQAQVARQQMTLMLNTVALLRDQLVAPQKMPSVGGQLDTLLHGVEAAREALRSVEKLGDLAGLEEDP